MRHVFGLTLATAGLAATLSLGLASTSASAAPFSGVSGPVTKTESSAVEKVGCWWRHGRRHCTLPFISFGHRHHYHHRRHWRR